MLWNPGTSANSWNGPDTPHRDFDSSMLPTTFGAIRRCRSAGVTFKTSAILRKLSANMPCTPGRISRKTPDRFMPAACAKVSLDIMLPRQTSARRSPETFTVRDSLCILDSNLHESLFTALQIQNEGKME